jgi:hypothetical protein
MEHASLSIYQLQLQRERNGICEKLEVVDNSDSPFAILSEHITELGTYA